VINSSLGNIGTLLESSSDKSVATGGSTSIVSIPITAGKWILSGHVSFTSHATGIRRINISGSSGSTGYMNAIQAVSGAATILPVSRIVEVTTPTTMYLNVYQNSGESLLCTGTLSAIKISG